MTRAQKTVFVGWYVAMFFLGTIALAHGTTYYVSAGVTGRDTNAGTSSTAPFLTIKKAADLTKPGDTVYLMNGTYAPFTITRAGTEGAYITYKNLPGQSPVVRKDGTAWAGISVEASYITISYLTVQGNARSITQAQADAANLSNLTTNGHCVSVPKTSHHVKILHNTLEYCPGAGIIFWSDYGWIEGNIIRFNAYWSHFAASGINIIGTNPTSSPGKIYVDGNLIYGNQAKVCNKQLNPCRVTDGHGLIVDSNTYATPGGYSGRVEIFNNISYANGGWGIVSFRSQHVDIYNNTTWHNGSSIFAPAPYTATGGEISVGRSTDIVVKNNIFNGSAGPMGFAETTNLVWDYNIMYNATSRPAPIGPHDLTLDPKFTTWFMPPQTFGLQESSPALGCGTPTLMPPTDYAGKPRFTGRVDCGAYTGWN